jgi:tetratricopeptide (TPR) repeat protein
MLDFRDRHPDACLLVDCRAAARQPQHLIDAVREHFGLDLGAPGELFEEDLMGRSSTTRRRTLIAHAYPEALALLERLRASTPEKLAAEVAAPAGEDLEAAHRDWALQYWADFCHLEKRQKQGERDYAAAQEGLRQVQEALRQAQEALRQSQEALRADRAELHSVRLEHERTCDAMRQVRVDLEATRGQVREKESQLHEARHLTEDLAQARAESAAAHDAMRRGWHELSGVRQELWRTAEALVRSEEMFRVAEAARQQAMGCLAWRVANWLRRYSAVRATGRMARAAAQPLTGPVRGLARRVTSGG